VTAQGSYIIQAEEMVRVVMRKENGVDGPDFLAQQLQAELWSRVDQDIALGCADEDGATVAMIARIRGEAYGTIAADHGYSNRRAGTQKRKGSRQSGHCTPLSLAAARRAAAKQEIIAGRALITPARKILTGERGASAP
jgi:hypothetical protein